jgi:hypothetical protein
VCEIDIEETREAAFVSDVSPKIRHGLRSASAAFQGTGLLLLHQKVAGGYVAYRERLPFRPCEKAVRLDNDLTVVIIMTASQTGTGSQSTEGLINVYDIGGLKQKLDKNVRDILLEEKGYKEDFTASNLKIVFGAIASISAIIAYFRKDSVPILILCSIYLVFGFISQAIGSYLEKKTILLTKSSFHSDIIRVESGVNLDKNEECPTYTLKIVSMKPGLGLIGRYRQSTKSAERKLKVNEFFDSNGIVHFRRLQKEVNDLLALVQGKKQE